MKLKALILATVLASGAMGQSVTLHMSEPPTPPQPNLIPQLDGLTVATQGITFKFSNPLGTLLYDVPNVIIEQYVTDPVVFGAQSSFSVAFSVPVSTVQFGLAVNSTSPVATMATLTLFNNGTQLGAPIALGSSQASQQPLTDPFAEVRFTYSGALGPVTSISIAPTGAGFSNLIFDELTVTSPLATAPSAVPAATPLTLAFTAIGLAGLTMFLLRKHPA